MIHICCLLHVSTFFSDTRETLSQTNRQLCLVFLKGHSQLAHMHIRYHFIANLHITKTRSILFLTKYDKNNIIG